MSKPKFRAGQIIASDIYMGQIINAFFAKGVWCYNIGENASVEKIEAGDDGYRVGLKFIKQTEIKFWFNHKLESWVAIDE